MPASESGPLPGLEALAGRWSGWAALGLPQGVQSWGKSSFK